MEYELFINNFVVNYVIHNLEYHNQDIDDCTEKAFKQGNKSWDKLEELKKCMRNDIY